MLRTALIALFFLVASHVGGYAQFQCPLEPHKERVPGPEGEAEASCAYAQMALRGAWEVPAVRSNTASRMMGGTGAVRSRGAKQGQPVAAISVATPVLIALDTDALQTGRSSVEITIAVPGISALAWVVASQRTPSTADRTTANLARNAVTAGEHALPKKRSIAAPSTDRPAKRVGFVGFLPKI